MEKKTKKRRGNPNIQKGKQPLNRRKTFAKQISKGKTGPSQSLSNSEREAIICHRAVEIKALEHLSHRQLGERLQKEFDLVYTPSVPTISKWLHDGKMALWFDIKEMQKQIRLEQFNELEEMKTSLRGAALRKFEVERTKVVDGERIKVVTEQHLSEQTKAIEAFTKLCARQAALLGLDLGREDGERGKETVKDLYVWINNHISGASGEKNVTPMKLIELEADGTEEPGL